MYKPRETVTRQLTDEIVAAKFDDLPSAAVERVKAAIMDDVGIAFMGYEMAGKPLVEYAKIVGGVPESTIIGDGLKVSCGLAAGINSQMAYDTNFEETGPGHHALSSFGSVMILRPAL